MKICLLYMSKNFRQNRISKQYEQSDLINSTKFTDETFPSSLIKSNYFSILKELTKLNHTCSLYYFDNPKNTNKIKCIDGVNIINVKDLGITKEEISTFDICIIRGNYPEWNCILSNYSNQVICIPCWCLIQPKTLLVKYNRHKFSILLDETENLNKFQQLNFKCELFQKPAAEIFYKQPTTNTEKDIDVIYICSKTNRPHKRFSLFLSCIQYLDILTPTNLTIQVVGNSTFHESEINDLASKLKKIKIQSTNKKVNQFKLIDLIDRSKIGICVSNDDANPRIISETMSRNVPILCMTDLKGGKFQIQCGKNGEICEPTKESISEMIIKMLSNINKYEANKHVFTIADAANQIIKQAN